MNFALFLEMHARSEPAAPAIVDPRGRLSYGQLDAAANRAENDHVRRLEIMRLST